MAQAPDPPASTPRGRAQVMAILNVTPDSFSDGGRYLAPERAIAQALQLVGEGADLLDLGAESTRPGFTPVSADAELQRLLPVLDALPAAFGGRVPVPVSIDTTKAAVAEAVLGRGATLINDIWGFQGDPALPAVVARHGARAVLMHNRATVDPGLDILDDMRGFFARSLAIAAAAGVPRERLILDPGIGFGKTYAQQLAALAGVGRLIEAFGVPVLVGASRKSFLRPTAGDDPSGRLHGTLAAHLAAVARGATVVRVHDVAAHVAALGTWAAIAAARP
ncbi:dihydropteroate synthase [Lichenihabitans sp. Uapishka_5]|uniref:dihydropteroate synthase n=1 Tax=Lichenihabitans sp. Uapishka_5 TaxID=3037302 RepID=UPI0029E7EBA8|nr:dihydropteroate synthase [Lichenihabitans sp. Uapishka_5]MDX7953760.1 dihydropteroate synthase [Lichenihabitans sp. Uapishka_5]